MPYPCWGPTLRCGFPPSSADQAANDTGYRSWPVPFLGYASGPTGKPFGLPLDRRFQSALALYGT